jgi:AraC-binding-like domain/DDE domain
VVSRGGELWATDAGTRDDVAGQWEHILSATYLPWTVTIPELPERNAFRGWVRRWPIDDILLADSRCGPCSGTRTRHQLADTEGEFVVVMIVQAGAETVSQRDTVATLTAGDVAALDSTRRNQFTVPESLSLRGMVIPRVALDEFGGLSWMRDGVVLDPTAPATRLLMPSVTHRRSKYLNNRAENSHQPTRIRERAMKRFASPGQAQRFLFAFSHIRQHFRPRRHLISAPQWRTEMTNRFAVWDEITVAAAA